MNNDGVDKVRSILAGIKEHKHYIKDDFHRHGIENFESGIRCACSHLGVELDD